MKTPISFLLLWFLAIPLLAQKESTGIIYSTHNNFKGCCIYIPATGFNLYDTPSGNLIGKIIKGSPEYGAVYKLYLQKDGHPDELIPYDKMEMVGYDLFSLVFTDKQDSFVKVLDDYWISIDEIKKGGLEAIGYKDFLINRTNEVLG
ncbi:hypothetical protein [Nafulsella turpanensis]|uniref:hypothetical protein n=1 Tax=Nafulsella turpanensis TaxID=1265690 RepID=UPI00037EBC60|nr:hypothetical protein [Nafulsella turpanensis]